MNSIHEARNHPAADRDLPPPALIPYHPMSQPQPFTHVKFADSMIARCVHAFNSEEGISTDAWHLLSTSTVFCPGCHMMFSIDGFQAHVHDGRCSKPGAHFSIAPSNSKQPDIVASQFYNSFYSTVPPSR